MLKEILMLRRLLNPFNTSKKVWLVHTLELDVRKVCIVLFHFVSHAQFHQTGCSNKLMWLWFSCEVVVWTLWTTEVVKQYVGIHTKNNPALKQHKELLMLFQVPMRLEIWYKKAYRMPKRCTAVCNTLSCLGDNHFILVEMHGSSY